MEIFVFLGFLVNAAMIAAGVVVIIVIWRGMKAHEKMGDSVARMADATERIEEIIKRDREPRV
jgi:cellulose biosynthesis protein BcsQ